MSELRVGITTRNDEQALPLCLESLERTLVDVPHEVVIVDCVSSDATVRIAEAHGAKVVVRDWSQSDSLNYLLVTSRARHTLLLHSDVVLLADDWYPTVVAALDAGASLVSPDDSGLGPHLRASYGSGKPESSFLFWRTQQMLRLRRLDVANALSRRLPFLRALDLHDLHVTHRLPAALERAGLRWQAMEVLASPAREAWFAAERVPTGANWQHAWGSLEYGFGNFYALDGTITHFHQWYSRYAGGEDAVNDDGVPTAYLREAAERFRHDYRAGAVRLPEPMGSKPGSLG